MLKELLEKDVCAICGKEVPFTAGHYVTIPLVEGENIVGEKTEFHCMECDPIKLDEEMSEPEYGGN